LVLFLLSSQALCVSLAKLRVSGNTIVNDQGQGVWLRGVDRSGTEFMCIQGYGFYDGPVDDNSINTIASWNSNIVRLPLNEDCWLGINGVKPEYGGQNYINAIKQLVDRFTAHNFAVILDLHWTAPGSEPATKQLPMPDTDHSLAFWQGVSQVFGKQLNVIFDLFNEPFPDNGQWNTTTGWQCLLNGGMCNGLSFNAAGMQAIVNAVRQEGAQNILMVGGLAYSNSLAMWLNYIPKDPLNNLAASWHSYSFNYCKAQQCWDSTVGAVAKMVPVIIGEMGTDQCNGDYLNALLPWADRVGAGKSIHYLAWTWNTWDCHTGPALISNYDGTPTAFGQGYKAHMLAHSIVQ